MIRIPVSSAAFCTQMRCRRKQKCYPLDLQWNFFIFALTHHHPFIFPHSGRLTLIKFNVYFCKSWCNAILVGIRVPRKPPPRDERSLNWSKGFASLNLSNRITYSRNRRSERCYIDSQATMVILHSFGFCLSVCIGCNKRKPAESSFQGCRPALLYGEPRESVANEL